VITVLDDAGVSFNDKDELMNDEHAILNDYDSLKDVIKISLWLHWHTCPSLHLSIVYQVTSCSS